MMMSSPFNLNDFLRPEKKKEEEKKKKNVFLKIKKVFISNQKRKNEL